MKNDLFDNFDLHGLHLPNRIVMSPMTRTRATEEDVATELMRDYYVQRAEAGLIITECTQVSDQAHGIIRAPGIHREDQIAAWRHVVDGVPATGDFFLPSGRVDFPVPRQLRIDEIPGIVEDFAQATRNAKRAGFDGVELHGANGYLQDQFLQDGSNQRTDAYGGPVENRARLMIETATAMSDAWSADRIGVRLSPSSVLYGMRDSDDLTTFGYVIRALDSLKVGYLHLCEPNAKELESGQPQIRNVAATFRPMTTAPIIVNGGFDRAKGDAVLLAHQADLVSFGVPFLSNPDLPERLRTGAFLNKPDPATFYGIGPKGYTDYPALGVPALA